MIEPGHNTWVDVTEINSSFCAWQKGYIHMQFTN